MADTKLTNLPNLAAPTGDDIIYVVDDPAGAKTSSKATLNSLPLGTTAATAPTFTGLVKRSVQAGVTADVGSAQGGSPITKDFVEISICANAGDSVTLPAAVAGQEVIITNHGAQSADVFPASGDAINEAAADSAKALAANATMLCWAYDSTNWECLTLAR